MAYSIEDHCNYINEIRLAGFEECWQVWCTENIYNFKMFSSRHADAANTKTS